MEIFFRKISAGAKFTREEILLSSGEIANATRVVQKFANFSGGNFNFVGLTRDQWWHVPTQAEIALEWAPAWQHETLTNLPHDQSDIVLLLARIELADICNDGINQGGRREPAMTE